LIHSLYGINIALIPYIADIKPKQQRKDSTKLYQEERPKVLHKKYKHQSTRASSTVDVLTLSTLSMLSKAFFAAL